jgi:hypothetical protein
MLKQEILKDMNAVSCVSPGCGEIAAWPSKLCSEHRLERKRLQTRERVRRFRLKKCNASNAPLGAVLGTVSEIQKPTGQIAI